MLVIRSKALWFAWLVGTLLCAGCVENPKGKGLRTPESGVRQANDDLANGVLRIRQPPKPFPPWWTKYKNVLRQSAGIEFVILHQTKDRELSPGDHSYNAVMVAKIKEIYGPDYMTKVARAVRFDEPMPPNPTRPSTLVEEPVVPTFPEATGGM